MKASIVLPAVLLVTGLLIMAFTEDNGFAVFVMCLSGAVFVVEAGPRVQQAVRHFKENHP